MTKNDITDRASWLAFRANWRLRYAAASQDVRDGKASLREAYGAGREASGLQSSLHYRRRQANRLMVELGEAKEAKAALMADREKAAIAA